MRWISLVVGCGTLVGVLFGAVAMAETPANTYFNYYVSNYPAPQGTTCDAVAKSIGDKLHAVTGVTIWSTDCESQDTAMYSMRVVYQAPKELTKVSTLQADTISESPGIYHSMDDCNQDLASQLATFRAQTGLQEVVGYCSPQPFYGWNYPVALVIESFGTAKASAYQFEDMLSGIDDTAMPTLLNQLTATAASQNIHLYSAVIGEDDAYIQQIRLGYYAANQLPIYVNQQLIYASYDVCVSQLADIKTGLGVAGDTPLAVFCEGNKDNGTLAMVLNDPGLKFEQAPQPYADMSACNADRDRVVQTYKAPNVDARYALCQGHDANQFYMYILERKN